MSLKQIQGISEDKFIGPYMIPRRRLKDANAMYEDLWGYLWNDVLKNRASSYFSGVSTFAELGQIWQGGAGKPIGEVRSEEHTSELQSLMRISYAVFCLKKKKTHTTSPAYTASQ